MPPPPVVVAPPFLFSSGFRLLPRDQLRVIYCPLLLLILSLFSSLVLSQNEPSYAAGNHYVADIQVHTADELGQLMERADQLLADGEFDGGPPVSFVLHGEEARVFMRSSYGQYKMLIDLAASLTALGVVNIRVCETWMGSQRLDPGGLQPFVGTVPNGVAEIRRLHREQNYLKF
jgi:intracellular sulfur oxidation DsrE/DsrF family protein